MLKKTVNGLLLSMVLLTLSTLVVAHSGASGVVKQRMDAMKDMKDSMKTISDMFKGKALYEADKVQAAAAVIRDHAGEQLTKLFPEGSLQHPTEAKPEIWQEWDRFSRLAAHLGVLSEGLQQAAHNTQATQAAGAMMSDDAMMGHGAMMGEAMAHTAEEYGNMPVEAVFKKLTDNCSSCHTDFRVEKDK
ncbi:c-type cytochrome [Pontibacter sp. JAM-7]|uniref:c-type cytochrome n=1 Tax=Pontibacter sp. JAM-7 TaxID=3366581 RepID=UPI003AF88343